MDYTVNDNRGKEKPEEVCRVCGSKEVHSRTYNQPTMGCIEYYRKQLSEAKEPTVEKVR